MFIYFTYFTLLFLIRVAPSERKEPSLQVSEFHLSKGEDSIENTVHLRHLAKSLNIDTNQVEIIRKLRATENKAKTLPKPLEKPTAERVCFVVVCLLDHLFVECLCFIVLLIVVFR